MITWTVDEAKERIPNRDAAWLKTNRKYYEGDHWQEGSGWTGPMLPDGHELREATISKLKKKFVFTNKIKQVVETHTAGVIGNMPKWSMSQQENNTDSTLAQTATRLLTTWLGQEQGIKRRSDDSLALCSPHDVMQQAVASLLTSKRGVLRLFISPSIIDEETGTIQPMTLDEAINHIYVQNPSSAQSSVYVDNQTMEIAGFYVYKIKDREFVEVVFPDTDEMGTPGITIQVIDDNEQSQEMHLPLTRLTIHEMEREIFVTDAMCSLQAALNKTLTMASLNLDSSGFLERIFLNADLAGEMETDPKTGKTRFVPKPLDVGPGTTNYVSGLPIGEGATQQYTNPSVVFRNPTEPTAFQKSEELYKVAILEEADQSHRLLASQSAPSGASRTQAKDGFKKSLLITQPEVEAAWRWLLETVLALTAVLANQPHLFQDIHAHVQAQLDLGIITENEKTAVITAYKSKLISQETALREYGIADPLTEIERTDSEAKLTTD